LTGAIFAAVASLVVAKTPTADDIVVLSGVVLSNCNSLGGAVTVAAPTTTVAPGLTLTKVVVATLAGGDVLIAPAAAETLADIVDLSGAGTALSTCFPLADAAIAADGVFTAAIVAVVGATLAVGVALMAPAAAALADTVVLGGSLPAAAVVLPFAAAATVAPGATLPKIVGATQADGDALMTSAAAAAATVAVVVVLLAATVVATVAKLTFVGFFSPPPAKVDIAVHSRPLLWVPAARTFVVADLVSFSAGISGCLLGLVSVVGDL